MIERAREKLARVAARLSESAGRLAGAKTPKAIEAARAAVETRFGELSTATSAVLAAYHEQGQTPVVRGAAAKAGAKATGGKGARSGPKSRTSRAAAT